MGDEIVVSWKPGAGLKAAACIRCFFAMKAALEAQSAKYRERFGVVPGFKAGFHAGRVTTGEIGTVKKDVFFPVMCSTPPRASKGCAMSKS